jgi:hypothetical protein
MFEGFHITPFPHANRAGKEIRVEIAESGDKAFRDPVALGYEQHSGPRAKVFCDDHVYADPPNRYFDGFVFRALET